MTNIHYLNITVDFNMQINVVYIMKKHNYIVHHGERVQLF